MINAASTSGILPNAIHQTWKHPLLRWPLSACAESFKKWNPTWEYHFWTDEESERFIRDELPDFLPTYLGYPAGIFRADIFRVALLYVRGGFYADLDVECFAPLDELLAKVPAMDWEVLLARDHPIHERVHFSERAMWMNTFFAAKPRSKFLGDVLATYSRRLPEVVDFKDPVNLTGPGVLSSLIESSHTGIAGYHIYALPWQLIHPLPDMSILFPERKAYEKLIYTQMWRDGIQLPLGGDDEKKPSAYGPPIVAHYWWHSYVSDSQSSNTLIRYADYLLQSDGEIVQKRLQRWVPQFGTALDALGQGLAQLAQETWRASRVSGKNIMETAPATGGCIIIDDPQIRSNELKLSCLQLASEVLSGLPIEIVVARGASNSISEISDRFSAGTQLWILSAKRSSLQVLQQIRTALFDPTLVAPKLIVVIRIEDVDSSFLKVASDIFGTPSCETGGYLWIFRSKDIGAIPKQLHLFASDPLATSDEIAFSEESWITHHSENWKIVKWGAKELKEFIQTKASQFLDTYLSYSNDATRFAAARYLVLREHGGIAVTLGSICLRPMDGLFLDTSAILGVGMMSEGKRVSVPIVSSDFIASTSKHPLWQNIEQSLELKAALAHAEAAGQSFLSSRLRESVNWIERQAWPRIINLESLFTRTPLHKGWDYDSGKPPSLRDLSQAFPNGYVLPLSAIPATVRTRLWPAPGV